MFFLVPLVLSVDLQSSRIHDDQSAELHRFAQHMAWQFDASFGEAAKVRNADLRIYRACHRDHEAFCLWNTWRIKIAVSMAWSEYYCGRPHKPVLAGRQPVIASSVNQTMKSPRRRNAALYAGQLVTLYLGLVNL
jgi:hypothetical protein